MPVRELSFPELMLIGSTRGMLGAGLALLLGERLRRDTRRGAGWALVLVGAVTTIPLALMLLRRARSQGEIGRLTEQDERERDTARLRWG